MHRDSQYGQHFLYACQKLKTLNLHNFDRNNATDMDSMFLDCPNLMTLVLDKDKFIISNNTDTDGMYDGCNEKFNRVCAIKGR